mgnify:CR=1 FL=1
MRIVKTEVFINGAKTANKLTYGHRKRNLKRLS